MALLAGASARRRPAAGAGLFALFLVALALWMLGSGLEKLAAGVPLRLLCLQLMMVGQASAPVLWLLFVLDYTHQNAWLRWPRWAPLCIVPAIGLGLALANARFHLVWQAPVIPLYGGVPGRAVMHPGPWSHVAFAYATALYLLCPLVILAATVRFPQSYRSQGGNLLVGALFPVLGSALVFSNQWPEPRLDPTPFLFALTGVLYSFGIFRSSTSDLAPVARDTLVENMSDGVLVIDRLGRLADSNPAARRLLNLPESTGLNAAQALVAFPDLSAFCRSGAVLQTTLSLRGKNDQSQHLDVRQTLLHDAHGENGKLVLLRDITSQRLADLQLRGAHEQLQARLAEIHRLQDQLQEQAMRDVLTGLFNRRYLQETLEREVSHAKRKIHPVAWFSSTWIASKG